jgi:hypothetical protein
MGTEVIKKIEKLTGQKVGLRKVASEKDHETCNEIEETLVPNSLIKK